MANSKKLTPSNLVAYVQQRLTYLNTSNRRITLALSGGLDSVVLFDLLLKLRVALNFSLSAVHVNHQISPHAADWANFCGALCAQNSVPLQIKKVQIARRSNLGLEASARAARYQAFAELDTDFLLLAHHLDDQVETLLQNLLRGTGLSGASGMPEKRHHAALNNAQHITLLRPLIETPRCILSAYAQKHCLHWMEDESNTDISFARNYLRHEILPAIENRFPAYRETLTRAARHFAAANEVLSEVTQLDLASVMRAQKLHLGALKGLSSARAMNVLRAYLELQGVPISNYERLQEWMRQLLDARGDRQVSLGAMSPMLRRFRGEAWVELDRPTLDPDWHRYWRGEHQLKFSELGICLSLLPALGTGISLSKITKDEVTIRLRRGGEKLQPNCLRPRRSLKHLLQEAAIPPWRRKHLPLLYCGEQLAAVAGIGVDCAFHADPDESSLLLQWTNIDEAE